MYCTATYFCLFVFVYDSFAMFVWQMYSHVQLILVFSFSSLFVFVTSCVVNDLFFFELSMRICQLLAFFFLRQSIKEKRTIRKKNFNNESACVCVCVCMCVCAEKHEPHERRLNKDEERAWRVCLRHVFF